MIVVGFPQGSVISPTAFLNNNCLNYTNILAEKSYCLEVLRVIIQDKTFNLLNADRFITRKLFPLLEILQAIVPFSPQNICLLLL